MLRRIIPLVIQERGLKNKVNIKRIKPECVPAYKPERSGDLESKAELPGSTLGKYYALSKEIEDAPESVKKMFSIAFLGRKEECVLVRDEHISRVKRYQYDSNTAETRIARMTGQIRCLQDTLKKNPKATGSKVVAQELIAKRKKLLHYMREYDYKKFEWLLENLNIEYKAYPESPNKLTRKQALRKLVELHCQEIKEKKLDDYQNLLESQQGPFLQEKINTLRFIRSEQQELQLPLSVSEQDVRRVEEALDQWKVRDQLKKQISNKKKPVIFD